MNLLYVHMIAVFLWAVFMTSLAWGFVCSHKSKLMAVLSMVFMLAVLGIGTKLMLDFPQVAKSGKWIHIKLSIDILAMILNAYMAFVTFKNKTLSKTFSYLLYFSSVGMFVLMYYFTLFKPF